VVEDNPAAQRFEANVAGHLAIIQYRLEGPNIVFIHTEVPAALEGKGVGSALVRTALESARERQLGVIPLCPFVASYIRRHQKEYLDLVVPEHRTRLLSPEGA
jgi:predicted GNAT family acetyltransferase